MTELRTFKNGEMEEKWTEYLSQETLGRPTVSFLQNKNETSFDIVDQKLVINARVLTTLKLQFPSNFTPNELHFELEIYSSKDCLINQPKQPIRTTKSTHTIITTTSKDQDPREHLLSFFLVLNVLKPYDGVYLKLLMKDSSKKLLYYSKSEIFSVASRDSLKSPIPKKKKLETK
jgi:hypothetical protein